VSFLTDAAIARLCEAAAWPVFDDGLTITGVAGRGGSATVYVARDEALDRDVAIKVLDVPDPAGRAAARLAREALILARLDHPGIVPVHGRGELPDGRAFYVMKLVRGRPLDVAASALAALPDRLALFARILDTVAFAHAHGVVHRDLKPANILVGGFGEVYVMDWGAAQADAVPEDELVVAGTPGFMAPEQERSAVVDRRADIFALGTVLTGLLGDDAPRAVRAIADTARAAEPSARYQQVAALADDLNRFRDGLAPSAYRESAAERLLRLYRRYELPVLLVLAYVLMRAGLLLWTGR
jgi:eukaryotic-like serine/threonine-protein kinase